MNALRYFLFFVLLLTRSLFSLENETLPTLSDRISFEQKKQPLIAVSNAPYKPFLDTLVQDIATVHVCVPGNMSAHTWEPKPKDSVRMKEAILWFGIGEPFEQKLLSVLQEQHIPIHFIDLREGIDCLSGCSCCHHEREKRLSSKDPHIWMSPPKLIQQIDHMKNALQKVFPSHAELLEQRAACIQTTLTTLHADIARRLQKYRGMCFVVAHSAYSYFCDEYHIVQLPIEQEGKEPTLQELSRLIEQAKKAHVHTIFTQKQYPKKAAEQIALALSATTFELDPYSSDYYTMMHSIAQALEHEGALQEQ